MLLGKACSCLLCRPREVGCKDLKGKDSDDPFALDRTAEKTPSCGIEKEALRLKVLMILESTRSIPDTVLISGDD